MLLEELEAVRSNLREFSGGLQIQIDRLESLESVKGTTPTPKSKVPKIASRAKQHLEDTEYTECTHRRIPFQNVYFFCF